MNNTDELNDDIIRESINKSALKLHNANFEDQIMKLIYEDIHHKKDISDSLNRSLKFLITTLFTSTTFGLAIIYGIFSNVFFEPASSIFYLFIILLTGTIILNNHIDLIIRYRDNFSEYG